MRAQEFIKVSEQWVSAPTPEIVKQWDTWDQQKRGRNALTTMPVPKTTPGYNLKPNNPFAPKPPIRMAPKLSNRLGPDRVVQPGTEEYSELRMKTDPVTGTIRNFGGLPGQYAHPANREQEQRSNVDPGATLDKGKEVTWPSQRSDKYQPGDSFRQKYRT